MRMRPAWVLMLVVVGLVALAGTRSAVAQAGGGQVVKLGEGETLTISGFVNATWYMNNGFFAFGNGQNAEWAAAVQPATDKNYSAADVRNTRLNFTFAGSPVLGKWSPKGTIEADFFGAFPATPAPPFADEQPQLRVRLAFADLTNGRTTLRIGQYWSPLFAEVPVSITHVAFPLGYGAAGMIGWRFPGIYLYHDLNPGKPTAMQLVLAAFEGSGPEVGAGSGIGQGEASAKPQLEARLNFTHHTSGLSWSAYVVGHVDWKDTTAVGVQSPDMTGSAVEVGANVTSSGFTIHGNVYTGKNIGQQFGHITQQVSAAGGIKGSGGWVQGGYEFTPHWGAWLFYGSDHPDLANSPGLTGNFRSKNEDAAGMLRFRAGRYQLGVEYFRANTTWATAGKQHATQVALSVMYTI
ncbi:MAG TPA: hypothetical protein VKQ05_05275 [Gemmatimonadales bacterium]|nr:hypothetical protein [Gemmatimonadales bacterium]